MYKFALVYQTGIANVFMLRDDAGTIYEPPRRVMQHAFLPCRYYAEGLAAAGAEVRTYSCNVAGDCAAVEWTVGTEGTPFRDSRDCVAVNAN